MSHRRHHRTTAEPREPRRAVRDARGAASSSSSEDLTRHAIAERARARGSARRDPPLRTPTAREIERFYRDEFGRVLATVIRLVGDFHVAEEAVQDALRDRPRALAARRAAREPARLAGLDRAPQGDRRAAPRGPPRGDPPRARPRRRSRRREPDAGGRRRRRHPRRAPAADLHLLPSGARARGAGGARAPHALRPLDRGDRARLPGRAGDPGATPGAREAQDRRRRHPVRGAAAGAAARAPRSRDGGRLPRLQRGLRGERGRRAACAPISAREAIRLGRLLVELLPGARRRRAACSR